MRGETARVLSLDGGSISTSAWAAYRWVAVLSRPTATAMPTSVKMMIGWPPSNELVWRHLRLLEIERRLWNGTSMPHERREIGREQALPCVTLIERDSLHLPRRILTNCQIGRLGDSSWRRCNGLHTDWRGTRARCLRSHHAGRPCRPFCGLRSVGHSAAEICPAETVGWCSGMGSCRFGGGPDRDSLG